MNSGRLSPLRTGLWACAICANVWIANRIGTELLPGFSAAFFRARRGGQLAARMCPEVDSTRISQQEEGIPALLTEGLRGVPASRQLLEAAE